jgi:hypothetical protein
VRWVPGSPNLFQLMSNGPEKPDRTPAVVEAVADILHHLEGGHMLHRPEGSDVFFSDPATWRVFLLADLGKVCVGALSRGRGAREAVS